MAADASKLVATPMQSDAEDTAKKAEECKLRGNAHIKAQEYDKAIEAYSEAIALSSQATFWLNRAIANKGAGNWESATDDASVAAELDPLNVKAHYMHALCLQHLKKYDSSLQACEVGLLLQADNKAIQQIQREVKHAKEQQDFREGRLAKIASMFARDSPMEPSCSSSSSDSSGDEGYMSRFKPPQKVPRELTEADAPYQELCAAALAGDLEECTRLLESGQIEDLSWKQPEDGNTALHVAADADNEDIVRALLEAKADPAAVNDFGLNAFCLAARDTPTYKLLNKITRRHARAECRRNARKTRGAAAMPGGQPFI